MFIKYNTPKNYKSVNEIITNGEKKIVKRRAAIRTVKVIKDKAIKKKPILKPNVVYIVPDEWKIFHTNNKLKIRSAE